MEVENHNVDLFILSFIILQLICSLNVFKTSKS